MIARVTDRLIPETDNVVRAAAETAAATIVFCQILDRHKPALVIIDFDERVARDAIRVLNTFLLALAKEITYSVCMKAQLAMVAHNAVFDVAAAAGTLIAEIAGVAGLLNTL